MVTPITILKTKLTLGSTELENIVTKARITRNENGFDIGQITLPDTSYYPSTVTDGTAVQFDVKDASDAGYTTLLKGKVRFPTSDINQAPQGKQLELNCLGAGYGFGEMLVGCEYGTQSVHPTLDTITEIITDASDGILASYVNKILDTATASGFSYSAVIETLTDVLTYIDFPYKPAMAALNDLIDLQSALGTGCHWIVTTDNVLHLKSLGSSGTGWSKYYGGTDNTAEQATLVYGSDYTHINLEKLAPECNYVVHFGAWRRPSNGDVWSEASTSYWSTITGITNSVDSTYHKVGASSIRGTYAPGSPGVGLEMRLEGPWDFSIFTDFNTPFINLYLRAHLTDLAGSGLRLVLLTDSTHYVYYSLTTLMTNNDEWYHVKLPVGNYWQTATSGDNWAIAGGASVVDWSDVEEIAILADTVNLNDYICVDGLHFGGANICRVAWNSDLPGGVAKMRLITDDIGKDDSLTASDDTGLRAQIAKSELLRLQSDAMVGSVETHLIKDALPGQLFEIQSTDYRATQIIHNIASKTKFFSTIALTDDVTNSRARPRYEDLNKQYAAIRPEWQDRQSSSMKANSVDWRITRLVKDYA